MAQRRMFSNRIANSAKFLQMPVEAQLLYFHLILRADDDGVVESYPVMRLLGIAPDNFKILSAKEFIKQLNEDQVVVITDWLEHNTIRADRKVDSMYKNLLPAEVKTIQAKPRSDVKNNSKRVGGPSTDGISKVRLGKVKLNKTTTSVVEAEPIVYGNEDINWVMDEFKKVFGMSSQGSSKKDRYCAKHLLNNYSREQIHYMMQFCTGSEYAPNVGSVEKLWYKRADIIAGIQKLKHKKTNQAKGITL